MAHKLSYIVTAYNVSSYIEKALRSVLQQGVRDSEVILVDDGSHDETLALAAGVLKEAPRAEVISQKNSGPGAARNAGLLRARSEYVVFLDGDDWFEEDSIRSLMYTVKTKQDIVFSNRRRFWEKSQKYTGRSKFTKKLNVPMRDMPDALSIYAIHGKLFRRKFLLDNEIFFPTGMSSEDFLFSYQCYARAKTVSSVSKVTYAYRKRADEGNQSLTQARLTEFNLSSRFRQIEMTQEVVEREGLSEIFPEANFPRLDYDTRLMRHLLKVPDAPPDVQERVLGSTRAFLVKHEVKALSAARANTKEIYRKILDRDFETAVNLIRVKAAGGGK